MWFEFWLLNLTSVGQGLVERFTEACKKIFLSYSQIKCKFERWEHASAQLYLKSGHIFIAVHISNYHLFKFLDGKIKKYL